MDGETEDKDKGLHEIIRPMDTVEKLDVRKGEAKRNISLSGATQKNLKNKLLFHNKVVSKNSEYVLLIFGYFMFLYREFRSSRKSLSFYI